MTGEACQRGALADTGRQDRHTLAEAPTDAMGDDHFRFIGRFMGRGHAHPDAFEELALDAFEARHDREARGGDPSP